jgi:hypothetical protein
MGKTKVDRDALMKEEGKTDGRKIIEYEKKGKKKKKLGCSF